MLIGELARFFYLPYVAMSLLPYVLRISKYTTILYPALMYAVMFYVILNKRKRLGHCVTYFVAIRARALSGTYRNVSKYALHEKNACVRILDASRGEMSRRG